MQDLMMRFGPYLVVGALAYLMGAAGQKSWRDAEIFDLEQRLEEKTQRLSDAEEELRYKNAQDAGLKMFVLSRMNLN